MRSAWWLALLLAGAAGCIDSQTDVEEPDAPMPPGPSVSEESVVLPVHWPYWTSLCNPVTQHTVLFATGPHEASLSPPPNLTAVRLEFSWTPDSPEAEYLHFFVWWGDRAVAEINGTSPLVWDLPEEAIPGPETDFRVSGQPALCPDGPTNTAIRLEQEVEVHAAYTSMPGADANWVPA